MKKVNTTEIVNQCIATAVEYYNVSNQDLQLTTRLEQSGGFMVWFDRALFTQHGDYKYAIPFTEVDGREISGFDDETFHKAVRSLHKELLRALKEKGNSCTTENQSVP